MLKGTSRGRVTHPGVYLQSGETDNKSDGRDDRRWRVAQQRRQNGAQTTMAQGGWSQGRPKEETEARMTRTWPWEGSEEEFQAEGPGGWNDISGAPRMPSRAATQGQRGVGIRAAFKITHPPARSSGGGRLQAWSCDMEV